MKQSPRKRMEVCITARFTKDVLCLCGSVFHFSFSNANVYSIRVSTGKDKAF